MASFTERYHELTKYNPHTIDRLGPVRWDRQPSPFKEVTSARRVDLVPWLKPLLAPGASASPGSSISPASPAPDPEARLALLRSLPEDRLEVIASLLYFTLGLNARIPGQGEDFFLRSAPSAGGLYPTELYIAVRPPAGPGGSPASAPRPGPSAVRSPETGAPPHPGPSATRSSETGPEGSSPSSLLPGGLYHYHSRKSALIPVWEGDFFGDLRHHFCENPALAASNLVVLFTGIYARSAWRYKERAYRRILLDTGHALGNLLELCSHLGLEAEVLGGFSDPGLQELLFLTAKEEFPLLGVAIRREPASAPPGQPSADPSSLPGLPSAAPSSLPDPRPAFPPGQIPGPPPALAVRQADSKDPMQVQQNACESLPAGSSPREAVAPAFRFPPFMPGEFDPLKAILLRRSCRKFSGESLALPEVRELLRFAFRSPPSGEAFLAPGFYDLHLIALQVDGLDAGVYALSQPGLELSLRRKGDFRAEALYMCLGQDLAAECAFLLVYTSDLARLTEAYGDRGYRYACLDAGQIGERLNLLAVARGKGSSGIGGYFDDQVNELLGLPLSHAVIYISLVGMPEGA